MADVAAFDFDGTLTNGGSVFDFLTAVSGRGRVLRASASLLPPTLWHSRAASATASSAVCVSVV